jgi:peptidoglycan/LPS O-acetylase OafA/YrhL
VIKSLEGGRGLAALMVAMYHLTIELDVDQFSALRQGYLFVDLFFVLSGYVICAAYGEKLNSLADCRSFFIRRFGRLFPLLVFSTIVYLVLANMIVLAKHIATAHGHVDVLYHPDAQDYVIPTLLEIVTTLTMTHSLGIFNDLILNTPSWSISTEFYTYLLFAAVCVALKGKWRLIAFALLSVIGFIVTIAASVGVHDCLHAGGCLSVTFDFGYPRTVFSFFLGALAFHFGRRAEINTTLWQLVGSAALLITLGTVSKMPAMAFAIPFIFAILILSVRQDEGWLAAILKSAPCQLLGERSYSIYMMHMPLVMVIENIAKRISAVPSIIVMLVYIAVLVTISGFTYRFVEDPFRAMFNRLASRRIPTPIHPVESVES